MSFEHLQYVWSDEKSVSASSDRSPEKWSAERCLAQILVLPLLLTSSTFSFSYIVDGHQWFESLSTSSGTKNWYFAIALWCNSDHQTKQRMLTARAFHRSLSPLAMCLTRYYATGCERHFSKKWHDAPSRSFEIHLRENIPTLNNKRGDYVSLWWCGCV